MARLITITGSDAPVNEGERRVVELLVEQLPQQYLVLPNAEIADRGGQRFEYDVIVVAPHAVYVIEVKDWHGQILGDEREWLVNGNTRRAPQLTVERKARILKSRLVDTTPALARVWTEALVCLASRPEVLHLSAGAARRTFALTDLVAFLLDATQGQKQPQAIADLTGAITQALGVQLQPRSGPLRFGAYEVEELLEQNGSEALYRAKRVNMPAAPQVLLRVVSLSPYLLSERQRADRRAALMRETEALLRMGSHPNIVAARDAFEDDEGRVVLVLDGAEGRSLRQRLLDGTPMTVEERLDVLIGICRALAHAHAHDVIHRHIEPETILLGEDGVTRLAHFDLAKLLVAGAATVWREELLGDIDHRYLAPEIEQPAYGQPTAATDLYELACVAYELFAGAPPFTAPGEAFTRTELLPQEAPERLREICAHLLRGDPALRLDDTKGVLVALEELRQGDDSRPVTGPKDAYEPGDVIDGKFAVRARLGGGGFSIVYRVYWAMDDREYAIKVFNASVPYDKVQREITILRALPTHQHIVRAVWADQTRTGQWYLVTELVEGETLEAYARGKKRLAPAEAVAAMQQLLEALEVIHPNHRRIQELHNRKEEGEISSEEFYELQRLQAEGIVHRDIKPQNLILSERGLVLIDFNIASHAGQRVETQSGTPPYQSPDVIAGLDQWSPSSDLFAVGVVLYELLCFTHPYEQAQPRLDRTPRDPHEYRSELAPQLAAFLLKACAPSFTDRFSTATEMRLALAAIDPLIITASQQRRLSLSPRLSQLLKEAPANVNPMVREFLALSSQARRTNRGTRGMDDVAAATYVETRLDKRLTESVLAGSHRLALVTGNAGDGKTAFIQQVEQTAQRLGATTEQQTSNGCVLRYQGRQIRTLYDGSQDEVDRTSDEVLRAFLAPFAIGAPPDDAIRLAAINEGRLRDFLLTHRAAYADFATAIIATLDDPAAAHTHTETIVVNLNLRSVTAGGVDSIFSRQLDAIVHGPFWKPCESCQYQAQCPLKYNVDTFRDSTSGGAATERLRTLLDLVRLRRRRHLTMRDVRSLISHILFRDHTCEEIPALFATDDPFDVLDLVYFQGPGGVGVAADTQLERGAALLAEVDVALVPSPEEDRNLARGHGPRRMGFPDRPSTYPDELLTHARALAGNGYSANVTQSRRTHEAARRQVYFERADDGWWAMLPYQRVREFTRALTGGDEPIHAALRREVISAISLYEGMLDAERAHQALWLATNEQADSEFRSFRRLPVAEFVLRIGQVAAPYVESEPDRLQLLHKPSGVQLDLDLDLLEMLVHLQEGYVSAMDVGRGFLINLALFKRQLLAQPTKELVIVANDETMMKISVGALPGSVELSEERP